MSVKKPAPNIQVALLAATVSVAATICYFLGFVNGLLTPLEHVAVPILAVTAFGLSISYLLLPKRWTRLLGNMFLLTTGAFLLSGQFDATYSADNNFEFYLVWLPAFYLMLTFADVRNQRFSLSIVFLVLSSLAMLSGLVLSDTTLNDLNGILMLNALLGQVVIVLCFSYLRDRLQKAGENAAEARALTFSAERLRLAADIAERAREQAEKANAAKSAFVANMSHELRTPLNAIIGFAEVLTTPDLYEQNRQRFPEYAEDIRKSGRHLLELVNDILDVAKIESGKMEVHEQQVNVLEALEASLSLVGYRDGSAMPHVDISATDPRIDLTADARQLTQMLTNVMSNAIKFTDPAGSIVCRTKLQADGTVAIEIEDSGVGMGPDILKNVTEKFVQGEDVYARSKNGSGLGLYLVKSMMELHQGACRITSKPAEGTTVSLVFPGYRLAADAA